MCVRVPLPPSKKLFPSSGGGTIVGVPGAGGFSSSPGVAPQVFYSFSSLACRTFRLKWAASRCPIAQPHQAWAARAHQAAMDGALLGPGTTAADACAGSVDHVDSGYLPALSGFVQGQRRARRQTSPLPSLYECLDHSSPRGRTAGRCGFSPACGNHRRCPSIGRFGIGRFGIVRFGGQYGPSRRHGPRGPAASFAPSDPAAGYGRFATARRGSTFRRRAPSSAAGCHTAHAYTACCHTAGIFAGQ